jgi:hypothetical protein
VRERERERKRERVERFENVGEREKCEQRNPFRDSLV